MLRLHLDFSCLCRASVNLPRPSRTNVDLSYNWNNAHYCPRYACSVNNGEWAGAGTANTEIAFYADGDVFFLDINR